MSRRRYFEEQRSGNGAIYHCVKTEIEPGDRIKLFNLMNLNSATVSINRLSDSKLSLWCLGALFDCCISRDKPFHPLTPPSDLRQYAVENRQEI